MNVISLLGQTWNISYLIFNKLASAMLLLNAVSILLNLISTLLFATLHILKTSFWICSFSFRMNNFLDWIQTKQVLLCQHTSGLCIISCIRDIINNFDTLFLFVFPDKYILLPCLPCVTSWWWSISYALQNLITWTDFVYNLLQLCQNPLSDVNILQ